MTAKEVLTSVRSLIGGTNSDKWSPQQLLDALNNSRTELVRLTGLLKTTGTLSINPDDRVYKLPTDCFYLTRAVYNEENIPFISMEELDRTNPSWFAEAPSDKLKYLVYDNLNQNEIMTYPVLSANAEPFEVTGTLGPIIDMPGIDNSTLYGAITEINDTAPHIVSREDNYGVLTEVVDPLLNIKIYYVKKPSVLYTENADVELDSVYKMYLVYKTAAELLSYDNSVENLNKSELFEKKAAIQIKDIRENNQTDYVQDKNITFSYKGAFDE